MNKLPITFILLLISIGGLYSQERTIKGHVIAENLENLPVVSIMINDTLEVGKTDANGYFQITIPVSVKKIRFTFLGLEVTNIILDDKCNEVQVVMMDAVIYDFMSLKKIDRKRKKRFKKLPGLRKKAFEKGIFKIVNTCYKQEFIPYYQK